MTIIHGMRPLPRLVGAALSERLRVMPAVVVTGARQTGKSTLAEQLVPARGATSRSTTSTCSTPPAAIPGCSWAAPVR